MYEFEVNFRLAYNFGRTPLYTNRINSFQLYLEIATQVAVYSQNRQSHYVESNSH